MRIEYLTFNRNWMKIEKLVFPFPVLLGMFTFSQLQIMEFDCPLFYSCVQCFFDLVNIHTFSRYISQ